MTKSHIVIGGNFIQTNDILNNPEILDLYCDSILIGDGEESIVQLAESVKNRSIDQNINGIIYKNKQNKIIKTDAKPLKNINSLAPMSLDGINLNEYLCKRPTFYFIISKGCYWGKCTFCSLGPNFLIHPEYI